MNICAKALTNGRHLVNKGDLGRQKGIRRVLYHFRGFHGRNHKGRFDEVKGIVEILQKEFDYQPEDYLLFSKASQLFSGYVRG